MKRDYPDRPIVAVGVVVIRNDQVLLIRRGKPPKPDQWSIPGGAQEIGETVVEAAVREVAEETAITINAPRFLDILDFIDKDEDKHIRHHYTLVDYAATYRSGEIHPGDDAQEAIWVPLHQLSEYNLWSETEHMIHKAIRLLAEETP
ncbi:NUDIX hydrolase [Paremcibacter congregatus]|uniref:Phosphohydrolase n=1 Tax=Paremcibacter congregatus TaxID=2043170 RepID=A0A2G4YU22_9PROT|nr:NUDIX hydrolase [Paremcibacter congregatus]PHZ85841.1 phosphohydrolase [Paremcibacter congregatus]QDE26804.1 NUDIX domain-containing protein [Paremcibacter congregatus]